MADVSVVIPTYNRADLLPRAIESALSQTAPPAEVVIVDDGSTDDTPATLARYVERHAGRVRVLRIPNGGVARARNAGIAAARSAWVALLDSDDEWVPSKLAVQMAALAERPDAGWSCSGCELIDGAGVRRSGAQSFEGAFPVFRERRISASAYLGAVLQPMRVTVDGDTHEGYAGDLFELLFGGNIVLPSSAVVRRALFGRVGVFDPEYRLAEETEFFHRVAEASPAVIILSPLVRYRVAQAGSLTASENTARLVSNALRSIDGAAARRQPVTASTRRAWRAGRQRLLLRLAYAELSSYHARAARGAAWQAARDGGERTALPRAAALWLGSFLPMVALRSLHAVKRHMRT
ncbi:MAG TPA: glycosyltransferase [Gemmatimonadaceae bacterium]|jgi:glycosyltransferase involved in cell wall biosynthesis|nr:glycosyltransferase [Gemmatimonadaceae bacterium]